MILSAKKLVIGLVVAGLTAGASLVHLQGALRRGEIDVKSDSNQNSSIPFDAATQEFLKQIATRSKPLRDTTPSELRAMNDSLRQRFGRGPEMGEVRDHSISTESGDFPVRVLVPRGVVRGVLVWFHGGGWVVGSIDNSDTLGRLLADEAHCAVVLVGYRLAPEHRFPTAADDSYAALVWTDKNMERIAGRRVPIIVGGDSAGGNLAAVTALRARDRNGPRIALQILVVPVTDASFDTRSYLAQANQIGPWSRDAMQWFWNEYVPEMTDRHHPDASPLRAGTLSGLPPAVVLTAEYDVLRDEGESYAERLRQAGVPVTHQRFATQVHAFFVLVNILPSSVPARALVVQALAEATGVLSR